MEYITLVNEKDEVVGKMEKMKVHIDGVLHRAFSIIIINDNNEMLIHKRNINKYHSGGLWTNACCSHPNYSENLSASIHRRLKEEMGFDCDLKEIFKFQYITEFGDGLIENEYDHVFIGRYNSNNINPDEDEVEDYKWIKLETLINDIKENDDNYTYWFKIIMKEVEKRKINIFEVI
jgi:isopentenyl-diphosphate delta-isomerase